MHFKPSLLALLLLLWYQTSRSQYTWWIYLDSARIALEARHYDKLPYYIDQGATESGVLFGLLQSPDTSEEKYRILSSLLKRGTDPNFPSNEKKSLLITALEQHDMKALQILTDAGADPFSNFHYANSALKIAILENQWDAVGYFLRKQPVSAPDAALLSDALLIFLTHADFSICRTLISLGALGERDSGKPNFLHIWATEKEYSPWDHQNTDTIHAWIDRLHLIGLNPDQQDEDGNTPLMLAIQHNNDPLADILLQYTLNLNIQNHKGETALHIAARDSEKPFHRAETLLERGADSTIRDNRQMTAGDYALQSNSSQLMNLLISNPAPILKRTLALADEFIRSDKKGSWSTRKALDLIREGVYPNACFTELADPDSRDDELARSFLSSAVQKGYGDIVKALLEAGADPNAVDSSYYQVPLGYVYTCDDTTIASLLLEYGAALTHIGMVRSFYDNFADSDIDNNLTKSARFFLRKFSSSGYFHWEPCGNRYCLKDEFQFTRVQDSVDQYTPFNEMGYCLAQKNGRWGVMNIWGYWHIAPEYDTIYPPYILNTDCSDNKDVLCPIYLYTLVQGEYLYFKALRYNSYITSLGSINKTQCTIEGIYTRPEGIDYVLLKKFESPGSVYIVLVNAYGQKRYMGREENIRIHRGRMQTRETGKWKNIKLWP